jgi:hypothetical protein
MKIDIKTILIVILGVLLLLTNTCSKDRTPTNKETIKINGKKYNVLDNLVDTQYITFEKIVEKPGKTIYKDTTIYIDIPLSVDTLNVLKSFFSKNVYIDTLKLDDSLGFIVLTDTIHQNLISDRIWYTKINKVYISNTKIVEEVPKNQYYFGFNTTLNRVDLVGSVGLSTTLKTKDDKLYNFTIGMMNTSTQISPYIGGGLQWRVKLIK